MNAALPRAELVAVAPSEWVRELAIGGRVPLLAQRIRCCEPGLQWHEVLLNPAARFHAADNLRFWAAAKALSLGARLDDRVLEATLDAISAGALPGRVSINLTGQSIAKGLATTLQRRCDRAGVDPGRLCLELSEGEPLDVTPERVAELEQLAAAGFRLALDDFGIGANHLGLLAHVPMDVLKVDASIFQAAARAEGEGSQAKRVFQAILGLSHAMGLAVVVEGVEANAKDLALAEALSGVALQGWGIAPLQSINFPGGATG